MTSTRQFSVGMSLTLLLGLSGGTAVGMEPGTNFTFNTAPSALTTPFTSALVPFQELALEDSKAQQASVANPRETDDEKNRKVRSDRNMRKFYLKLLLMKGTAP